MQTSIKQDYSSNTRENKKESINNIKVENLSDSKRMEKGLAKIVIIEDPNRNGESF